MSQPSDFNQHKTTSAMRTKQWSVAERWQKQARRTWSNQADIFSHLIPFNNRSRRPFTQTESVSTSPMFTRSSEKIHRDESEAARHTSWIRTYSKATNYKRKALRCSIWGEECYARPDSASDRDIITEAFAKEHSIAVYRGNEDKSLFKLGTGKVIESTGRALVRISICDDGNSTRHIRWFDVLAKCPAPMILVDCPYNFWNLPTLKWIGSPQERIKFLADGKSLTAGADTGSDLDLMSLDCARKRRFKIDTSQKARSRVMLADETIVETIGQVKVSSVQLSHFNSFEMSFHVLPGLPCDVIFGEEFLDQMDAFNTCDIVHLDENIIHSLNTLINLGPIQAFLSRKWAAKRNDSVRPEHEEVIEAENYRRNKANRTLAKIKDETRLIAAKEAEEAKRRAFDARHLRCLYCIGALSGREHLGR